MRRIAQMLCIAAALWLAAAGAEARFLQTDPIGYAGGLNPYVYAGNDAVNASDPTGLLTSSFNARPDPRCTIGGYCPGDRGPRGPFQLQSEGEGSIWDRLFQRGRGHYDNADDVSIGLHGGNIERFGGSLEMSGALAGEAADEAWLNGVAGAASEGDWQGVALGVVLFASPGRIECHHCIPRQILRQLSPTVRRAIQRGNIVRLPFARHRGAGTGIHSEGYNRRWQEEVDAAGGARNLSAEQVLDIDRRIRAEFDLPPRQ